MNIKILPVTIILIFIFTSFNVIAVGLEATQKTNISVNNEKYDMVIIAPNKFSKRLKPLIDHKNIVGVKTILKTTESIYFEALKGEYESIGRDKAEKIKLFIYWAKENWDIKYVLLAGGKNPLGLGWHIPVRYSNLDDEPWNKSNWETSYLSDLYFADIYRYNQDTKEYEFDDWDSNGNNIFAEWSFKWVYNETDQIERLVTDKKDVLDLNPDVYIGRIPCRTKYELTTIVNKIIAYEKNTHGSEWFKKAVLAGGDSIPPVDGGDLGIYEGELVTELSGSYLEPLGFNLTKLWVSNGNLTGSADIIHAINQGAGFVHLSGHGSALDWGTHPANTTEENDWIDGLMNPEMKSLTNSEKLPIVLVGGCHSNQFDVGFINLIKGILKYRLNYFMWNYSHDCFSKWEWIPRCFSENFLRIKNGGSIATIGNTGLGWESYDEACIDDLSGWIETHFFEVYANSDEINQTLGKVHSQTISDYITVFSPNYGGESDLNTKDRKTVEQWVLFGDPSLKIGGYQQ